jgi:hypothetical protein
MVALPHDPIAWKFSVFDPRVLETPVIARGEAFDNEFGGIVQHFELLGQFEWKTVEPFLDGSAPFGMGWNVPEGSLKFDSRVYEEPDIREDPWRPFEINLANSNTHLVGTDGSGACERSVEMQNLESESEYQHSDLVARAIHQRSKLLQRPHLGLVVLDQIVDPIRVA